jgi:hypothetical protein
MSVGAVDGGASLGSVQGAIDLSLIASSNQLASVEAALVTASLAGLGTNVDSYA